MSESGHNKFAVESAMFGVPRGASALVIHAYWRGGKLIRCGTGEPIELNEGTFVEARIFDVPPSLASIASKVEVPFLRQDCELFYGVRALSITHERDGFMAWEKAFRAIAVVNEDNPIANRFRSSFHQYLWLKLALAQNLWLAVRGDRPANLLPCMTRVPGLDLEARSLNSAITKAAMATQRDRQSFSENAFRKVIVVKEGIASLLDWERIRIIAAYHRSLLEPFGDEPEYDPRLRLL